MRQHLRLAAGKREDPDLRPRRILRARRGSVALVDTNASREPSGLHRGEVELKPSADNRRGGIRPSTATTQIEESRRFFALSTVVAVYATCFPSGEMCASEIVSNAK